MCMSEFYNIYNENYVNSCKQPVKLIKIKIELLDWSEQAVGEITTNIVNASGSININYQQGTRRTCSISIVDKQILYLPSENSPFWYNKKFKIYLGIASGNDIYYWSQGVFLIQTLSFDNNYTLNIEGIDKFGLFDGSLNLLKADTNYNFLAKDDINIYSFIEKILLADIGNGYATDCIQPIIDFNFFNKKLQADISLDNGNFVGNLLIELANTYGADIYYDADGHLIFHRIFGDVSPASYQYIAPQWYFNDTNCDFLTQNNSYQLDGHNRVFVYTNSSGSVNYSYTALNTNPSSPLDINAVGTRSLDDVEIALTQDLTDDDCRQYGEYLLAKECRNTVNSELACNIIPHLDVNKIISITNKQVNYNDEKFIINSINLPIGTSEMSISAANIQFLPDFTTNVNM